MEELNIQFSTSPAFASSVIRRLCHSEFSHCDIIIPGKGLLGVSGPDKPTHDPGGVRIRPFNPWPYLYPPKIARLHPLMIGPNVIDNILELAQSQIGKPFDNSALWAFLSLKPSNRNWRNPDKWFCSEFVAWALEGGGFFPYQLISAKNRITPADLLLLLNPFMSKDNIEEFRS